MSLQHAAKYLASHGRGPDTTLVHMTKDEVKSLNNLAMAHGGHLTINPDTGLPEAGFLSAILPMAAGFALGPAGFGLMSAGAAGMTVGAVTGLASGSLSKGLMAGMGAYGGAGLGDALAKSGMEQAAQGEMAKNAAMEHQAGVMGDYMGEGFGNQGFGNSALQNPAVAAQQVGYGDLSVGDKLGTVGQGIKSLGTGQGWSDLASNAGGAKNLTKYGLAAMSPILDEANKASQPKEEQEQSSPNPKYKYNSGASSTPMADKYGRERAYYGSQYTPYAEGGRTDAPGTPTEYSYDAANKSYTKISKPKESSKSDDSEKGSKAAGKGTAPMSDAAFAAQMAAGEANAKALGMEGMSPAQMVMMALVPGLATLNAIMGMNSSGAQGPASSPGESASSSTGSGNQAAKAAAISNAANGEGDGGGSSGFGGDGGGASSGLGGASGAVGTGTGVGPGSSGSGSGSGGLGGTGGIGGMGGGVGGGGAGAGVGGAGGGASGGYIANQHFNHHMASGGLSDDEYNLGSFSDGGRLLRGPGDGVSDSIPAVIGKKQPARLADGEFVVPARIVSELGNGSTEAGARKLYSMMDRIQSARSKTVGKGRVAKNSKAEQYLPA